MKIGQLNYKMNKEFNLSEKIQNPLNIYQMGVIPEKDVKEFIKIIEDWCYKNNTIKIPNTNLKLAITDGGWVNVIELINFIKEKTGDLK